MIYIHVDISHRIVIALYKYLSLLISNVQDNDIVINIIGGTYK